MSIDHYENFPVASLLCPPAIRPAVMAIYHFARTADDIADEGNADTETRLRDLEAYGADLDALYGDRPTSRRWAAVFEPLEVARVAHALPRQPLSDLLEAFRQDTGNPLYETRQSLLDYCRRSANPVGRLLLHLYGVDDPIALKQSDAICSALQLINFWQDCSIDLPRERIYIPLEDARRHGIDLTSPATLQDSRHSRAMLAELCAWAAELMHSGAPLVHVIPGRAGWELRLVVQGGLRVLERIAAMGHSTIRQRPALAAPDFLPIAWRAMRMRPHGSLS